MTSTTTLLHFDHPVHPAIKGKCFVPQQNIEEEPASCSKSHAFSDKRLYESPTDLNVSERKNLLRRKGRPAHRPKAIRYRYQGEVVKTLWIGGELRPSLARQLRPEIRMVMGFWRQPEVPTRVKAFLCGFKDSGEFLELNRKLLTEPEFTRVDAIRHCILHGLPLSAAVKIKEPTLCRNCYSKTVLLPCVRCWRGMDDDPTVDECENEQAVKEHEMIVVEPTRAIPGTPEKIAVLRRRQELRQPLWHPDDPMIHTPIDGRWWLHS